MKEMNQGYISAVIGSLIKVSGSILLQKNKIWKAQKFNFFIKKILKNIN